jgi:hypothetical protein
MNSELEIFGKLIVESLRDRAIRDCDLLLSGRYKAPALQSIQKQLEVLNSDEIKLLKSVVQHCIDSSIHDFLFKLQEENDLGGDIEVLINGNNVAELSDGLQGELFTEDGWFAKYSAYGEPED